MAPAGDDPARPPVRILSLFSGIGGLELGLELAGLGPVVGQVEADPYCRDILELHWPNVERCRYVQTLASDPARAPDHEILAGGFPCQDLSAANQHGKGLEGERSGLWFAMLEIVRAKRPPLDDTDRRARLRAYGNAVVPMCGYVVGLRIRQRLGLGVPIRLDLDASGAAVGLY